MKILLAIICLFAFSAEASEFNCIKKVMNEDFSEGTQYLKIQESEAELYSAISIKNNSGEQLIGNKYKCTFSPNGGKLFSCIQESAPHPSGIKTIEEVVWSVAYTNESYGFPNGGKLERFVIYKQKWDFDAPSSDKLEIMYFDGNPKNICVFK